MSIKTYANWPQGGTDVQYAALKEVLDRAPAQVAMDIACDKRTHSRKSGAAVNLRRWVNPAIDTTALSPEGTNPSARQLVPQDYTGTLSRYAVLYAVSRQDYDLSPYDAVSGASAVLADHDIPGMRERIRYNAGKSITSVFYNSSAIASRATVNGTISLGRLQAAVRQIRGYKGEYFKGNEAGQARDGTAPVENALYAFCSSDLEPDLRLLPGFKTCAEYPSGKGLPFEFGAVQNVRFFTSPDYVPYLNGGAASTTLISTGVSGSTSGNADVYPIVVLAKHALTSIPLAGGGKEGFGNAKVNVIEGRDSGDPTGERIYVEADWYDLCVVTSNEWGAVIEVGATRNPT